MGLSAEEKVIEEHEDSYDFTIHCSSIYSAALVSPENAWANFVQKINYANQFIEGFEDKGYSKVNLGSQIYDIETHRKLVESCKTHLEETYSDCLMDFKATDSSVDLSIIIEAMLPKSARTDLDNLLGYDRLMINAVNLKYREALLTKNSTSKSKDTNRITSFADTLKEIPDVISAAISNPKETLTKAAAPLAIAGSLLMSGFASAFDSNHDVAPDSADTAYQEMLHKLDSILSDLPDILPVAAAQPVTQNIPQQPTMFAGYAFLDGSIVNSSEVSLTAVVNGTSYNITSWFTDGSGDDYFSITIPYDDSNAGKNVTFFCLDDDTNQEFKSEENGTMVSGGSYYPYNVSFIDDKSSIFYNQSLSIFANDLDDKLDDVNFSITTNENVSFLVKEGASELLNSTDLKKYWNFILNNQTEGKHDYTIIVSDKNNNSKTTQLSTTIDTTQPGLIDYLVEILDGDNDGKDVKLTLNLTEPASTYATIMGLVANATNSTFSKYPILNFNDVSTAGNYSGFDLNMTDLLGNTKNVSIIFPINITKEVVDEDSNPPVVNPPSGGGGGGGTGGEDYENVLYKFVLGKQIIKDVLTKYYFDDPNNPINYIEFFSETNKGSQNLNIQVLNGMSALVDEEPEDIFLRYSMYLGLVGTEHGLYDINKEIGISENIISDNSLDLYSIRVLYHDDSEWEELETEYRYHDKVNGKYVFSVKNLDHISGNYVVIGKPATMIPMPTDIGEDKPDIPQSEPDNSDVPETSPSTENNEDSQDPADEEDPESTPNLLPWAPFLTAAYLLTLRKDRNKN